jgi:hypothetical protein
MSTLTLRLRALGRAALFTLAFTGSASGVWMLSARLLEHAKIKQVSTSFVLHSNAVDFRKRFAALRGEQRIALVGDSTLMDTVGMSVPNRQTVPARLATRRLSPRIRTRSCWR